MSTIESLYSEFRAADAPAFRAERDVARLRYRILTRALDVAISVLAIIVLAPLLVLSLVLVALTSKGPAVFRQDRVGKNGTVFSILKLRTMYLDKDDDRQRAFNTAELAGELDDVEEFTLENDDRITPLGAVLRKMSIDELPQLWNVIRGDMALVGPRPSCVWEVEMFDDRYDGRLLVRPGITGLWQVVGRRTIDMRGMLELDLLYVARRSLRLDIEILARTIPTVLRGTGAS